MKIRMGLVAVLALGACDARVSVGELGLSPLGQGGSDGSTSSGGSKPSGVLPEAGAGTPAEPAMGEGGAGLTGPVEQGGGGSVPSGGSSTVPLGPYAPRSGNFTMVGYSKTSAFRHEDAIQAGKRLLQEIADEQGFDLLLTEDNAFLANLENYELVLFLNTTGDVFNDEEQLLFERWLTRSGAFVGTHSATDTEFGWPFYQEVVGQNYDGHTMQGVSSRLDLAPAMLDHPALRGLPNPWMRTDEWFMFKSHAVWSIRPGFEILARHAVAGLATDGYPAIWQREWGNFRAFYSSLGHNADVYSDPLFKRHLTGGIMWAVRREHLLE